MRVLLHSAAAAAALALLAVAPLSVRGDELADLLRARLESTLEKHHHKTGLIVDPCQLAQVAFNTSADALLATTTSIYSTVISNNLAVPKCPANPSQCAFPTSSTSPADVVAVFENLELPYGTEPTLASFFQEGHSEIDGMTVSCQTGTANSCTWSSSASTCGKTQ